MLADYTDEDIIKPRTKKKKPTNLLRRPSRNRQKIERTRRIAKQNKTSVMSSNNRSTTSGNVGTSPPSTISDSISSEAELITTPNKLAAITVPDITSKDNQASTSSYKVNTTVLRPASREETDIAIDALLSLGRDLEFGTNTKTDDNENLQPIAPRNVLPDPAPMVSELNTDDPEIQDEQPSDEDDANGKGVEPKKIDTRNKKGQLIVQNYQLARKYKPKRRFSCVVCRQKFINNKELNDHFKVAHPPLTCSDCKKLFSTPSAFEKHKYTHYEYMYECKTCNKGFHFHSELTAHRRRHIADQGLVCFHPRCRKRFKRSSKLNAHLKNHTGKAIKCDHCDYTNKDIRNVRAHARKHSNVKGFLCKCGQTFKWGSQKKRHLDSGKCPGH